MSEDSVVEASVPVAAPVWPDAVFEVGRAVEFRDILKVLDTTLEEASFHVARGGVSVRGMDPSHVAMLELDLPREFFDVYRVVREGVFSVNVGGVLRVVFRRVLKDTGLYVGVEEERVLFELRDSLVRRKFVPLLEPLEAEVPVPKLVLRSSIRIAAGAFKRIVEDFDVSEHLTIAVGPRGVAFSAVGGMGREETSLGEGDVNVFGVHCLDEVQKSAYTLSYLQDLVKVVPAVCDVVELGLSSDFPLRVELELRGAGSLVWWLAPCVGV